MDGMKQTLTVRSLREDDIERLVKMDQALSGQSRRAWYEGHIRRALEESDVRISLGCDIDSSLVGAMLGSVEIGEFGQLQPTAILDTVLVDPRFGRKGIASAMLAQLLENLNGLRIGQVRTQLSWDELDLMAFFGKAGFQPVPRLVLELDVKQGLESARERADMQEEEL